MIHAQFAGSQLTATSKFFRLFVQSVALGLGALLAIAGYISAGAIIASSVLLSRALQPIESIIGGWSSLASARAALQRLSRAFETIGEQRLYTALPAPKGLIEVEEVGLRGREGKPILVGHQLQSRAGQDPRDHRPERVGQDDARARSSSARSRRPSAPCGSTARA